MLLPARHAENKGFTLVELMIAIVIMSVGLLALLQTVNLAIAQNSSTKLRNDAVLYADQAVGEQRARAFSAVVSSSSSLQHKISGLVFVNYSIVNTVSQVVTTHSLATDGIAGVKNLQSRVSWRDKGSKKNHIITTTIVETAN